MGTVLLVAASNVECSWLSRLGEGSRFVSLHHRSAWLPGKIGRHLSGIVLAALYLSSASFAQTWESPYRCGSDAGLYRSDSGRDVWVRKTGSLSRVGGVRGSFHVVDLVYDDLQTYFLVGVDPARMVFREDLNRVEHAAIQWDEEIALPSFLHIVVEAGLPGPVRSFVRCELAPAPLARDKRKEFWE